MLKRIQQAALLGMAAASILCAGGLYLEAGNPDANPAAKKLGAVLVARVTACHEPAKSKVTASLVRKQDGEVQRQPLQVQAIPDQPGVFAVLGKAAGSLATIELTVTNPEYGTYAPRTLVTVENGAIQWGSIQRAKPATAGGI